MPRLSKPIRQATRAKPQITKHCCTDAHGTHTHTHTHTHTQSDDVKTLQKQTTGCGSWPTLMHGWAWRVVLPRGHASQRAPPASAAASPSVAHFGLHNFARETLHRAIFPLAASNWCETRRRRHVLGADALPCCRAMRAWRASPHLAHEQGRARSSPTAASRPSQICTCQPAASGLLRIHCLGGQRLSATNTVPSLQMHEALATRCCGRIVSCRGRSWPPLVAACDGQVQVGLSRSEFVTTGGIRKPTYP
jgi:hypothetical protein